MLKKRQSNHEPIIPSFFKESNTYEKKARSNIKGFFENNRKFPIEKKKEKRYNQTYQSMWQKERTLLPKKNERGLLV